MEAERNWGAVKPNTIEGFDQLSEREQKAVVVALEGLTQWQRTGLLSQPMRVQITEDNPFDVNKFTAVLHSIGVEIDKSKRKDESGAYIFQPLPDRTKQSTERPDATLDELRRRVNEEIGYVPEEVRDMFRKNWGK